MGSHAARDRLDAALAALDAEDDPAGRIALVQRMRVLASELEVAEVRAARKHGLSWSRIGAAYGLTKQGAQQRFRADEERGPRRDKSTR